MGIGDLDWELGIRIDSWDFELGLRIVGVELVQFCNDPRERWLLNRNKDKPQTLEF